MPDRIHEEELAAVRRIAASISNTASIVRAAVRCGLYVNTNRKNIRAGRYRHSLHNIVQLSRPVGYYYSVYDFFEVAVLLRALEKGQD